MADLRPVKIMATNKAYMHMSKKQFVAEMARLAEKDAKLAEYGKQIEAEQKAAVPVSEDAPKKMGRPKKVE
ncbi:MAG: hypothetical protein WC810_03045 [Janthinobacterium sp.]|jgi:hypothetical protein